MVKLLRNGKGSFFVTIPMDLVGAKGWEKGQKFAWVNNERGNLELLEVKE